DAGVTTAARGTVAVRVSGCGWGWDPFAARPIEVAGCGTGCGCPGRRTLRSGIGGCRASSSAVGGTSGATKGATIDDAIAETMGGTIGAGCEIGGSVAGVSAYMAFWSTTTVAGEPVRRLVLVPGFVRVSSAPVIISERSRRTKAAPPP